MFLSDWWCRLEMSIMENPRRKPWGASFRLWRGEDTEVVQMYMLLMGLSEDQCLLLRILSAVFCSELEWQVLRYGFTRRLPQIVFFCLLLPGSITWCNIGGESACINCTLFNLIFLTGCNLHMT
jgi:hypothetical protein